MIIHTFEGKHLIKSGPNHIEDFSEQQLGVGIKINKGETNYISIKGNINNKVDKDIAKIKIETMKLIGLIQ
jgi:hypothetical protein